MRKLLKNSLITVKAYKRHKEMINTDSGRSLLIKPDAYTNCIPFAVWYYWILKKIGNRYNVFKVIPCEQEHLQ